MQNLRKNEAGLGRGGGEGKRALVEIVSMFWFVYVHTKNHTQGLYNNSLS